jgi:FMN phosphatase YigB (HAD superfamily)
VTPGPVALVFDVFGTVVDWRSSVIREGEALGQGKGFDVDWTTFADAWRGRYAPSVDRVRKGKIPWMTLDDLRAAGAGDLRTAYVPRPFEFRSGGSAYPPFFDLVAGDFLELAEQLGA